MLIEKKRSKGKNPQAGIRAGGRQSSRIFCGKIKNLIKR
jgi:hypothetical protein